MSSEKHDDKGFDDVWLHIVWSLKACYIGKWPTHDPHGNPIRTGSPGEWLADGWFLVVWAVLGDLDYMFHFNFWKDKNLSI